MEPGALRGICKASAYGMYDRTRRLVKGVCGLVIVSPEWWNKVYVERRKSDLKPHFILPIPVLELENIGNLGFCVI